MPTYQYVCTECGGQLEAVQKFTDEPLTVHEDCGGRLRKVFSAVGIVFKGSGFYKTDSRSDRASSSPSSSKPESDAPSAPAESPSSAKSGGDSAASSTTSSASTSSGSSGEKVA